MFSVEELYTELRLIQSVDWSRAPLGSGRVAPGGAPQKTNLAGRLGRPTMGKDKVFNKNRFKYVDLCMKPIQQTCFWMGIPNSDSGVGRSWQGFLLRLRHCTGVVFSGQGFVPNASLYKTSQLLLFLETMGPPLKGRPFKGKMRNHHFILVELLVVK